jgi:hypothetical protein
MCHDVEDVWSKLKTPLLDTAKEVYGTSKIHQWRQTWWWNDNIDETINQSVHAGGQG